jgi:hypothetical protein
VDCTCFLHLRPGRLDREDEANHLAILDAVPFIARMYALHDDGSTEVVLVHGYFGARPQLRISVWKLLLARASVLSHTYALEPSSK